jgi:hypothetical protein
LRKIATLSTNIGDLQEAAHLYDDIAASDENAWTCYNAGTLHLKAGT